VARWILQEEVLSPNLQARFCKLYPSDFSVAIYLFLCSWLSGFVYDSFSSNPPPDKFSNRVGRVSGSAKCTGFNWQNLQDTACRIQLVDFCLNFPLTKSILPLALEHKNKQIVTESSPGQRLQNQACRFGLKNSSRKIHPVTGVSMAMVIVIHILLPWQKFLAVSYMSSAPQRVAHLFENYQIRRRVSLLVDDMIHCSWNCSGIFTALECMFTHLVMKSVPHLNIGCRLASGVQVTPQVGYPQVVSRFVSTITLLHHNCFFLSFLGGEDQT